MMIQRDINDIIIELLLVTVDALLEIYCYAKHYIEEKGPLMKIKICKAMLY